MNNIQFCRQILLLKKIVFVMILYVLKTSVKNSEGLESSLLLTIEELKELNINEDFPWIKINAKVNKKMLEKYTNFDFMFKWQERIAFEFMRYVLLFSKRTYYDVFSFINITIKDSISYWMNSYFWTSVLVLFLTNRILNVIKKNKQLFFVSEIIYSTQQDSKFEFTEKPISNFLKRTKDLFTMYFFDTDEYIKEKTFLFEYINYFIDHFIEIYETDKKEFNILMWKFWYIISIFVHLFIKYILFFSEKIDKDYIFNTDEKIWKFENIVKEYFWNEYKNIEESINKLNLY